MGILDTGFCGKNCIVINQMRLYNLGESVFQLCYFITVLALSKCLACYWTSWKIDPILVKFIVYFRFRPVVTLDQ